MPPNPARFRTGAIVGTVLVLVLGTAGYLVLHSLQKVISPPPAPGCQLGTGEAALTLDTDQAAVAATIAGVAARHHLPRRAVTIALAASLQESKLRNLDYGDRDSVGIFQQRPSEGWGPAGKLLDPVYATTKFFAALTRVPGYVEMPVYQAAQDVQHSADGSAYAQWTPLAGQLAGYFTGQSPHGVSCWYTPPGQANLAGAVRQLTHTFGPAGREAVVTALTLDRSGKSRAEVVRVQRSFAWAVAGWLVANARDYGLREVRYAGYVWKAADGSMGWQPDPDPTQSSGKTVPQGGIVAG